MMNVDEDPRNADWIKKLSRKKEKRFLPGMIK
jgi:hypothetical protein